MIKWIKRVWIYIIVNMTVRNNEKIKARHLKRIRKSQQQYCDW